MGEREYGVTTSLAGYQYGAATCSIPNSTSCIRPHIPAQIGLVEMADIHRGEQTLINASEELRQNVGTYFERFDTGMTLLPNRLQQIRKQLITAHKTFVKVGQQTGEIKKKISEIKVTTWWEDLWDWGSNIQIHPWVGLLSHLTVIGILLMAVTEPSSHSNSSVEEGIPPNLDSERAKTVKDGMMRNLNSPSRV